MATYPLRALVLRKTRLGETDCILTLLAEDGRQVRAVAKGARKPGSRFGGRAEPYNTLDLLVASGRSLEVVSEARTVSSRPHLSSDLGRSAAAAVVSDVLDKVSLEGQTEPRSFGLACATLDALATAPEDRITDLVIAFLLKAMALHGYRPELRGCCVCGQLIDGEGTFSLESGGVACVSCVSEGASGVRLRSDDRAWLADVLASTMAQVVEMPVDATRTRRCFPLVRSFVVHHLPVRLKALDFYANGPL